MICCCCTTTTTNSPEVLPLLPTSQALYFPHSALTRNNSAALLVLCSWRSRNRLDPWHATLPSPRAGHVSLLPLVNDLGKGSHTPPGDVSRHLFGWGVRGEGGRRRGGDGHITLSSCRGGVGGGGGRSKEQYIEYISLWFSFAACVGQLCTIWRKVTFRLT